MPDASYAMKRIDLTKRKRQRGTAMVEVALCIALFWAPLFLGTYEIGFEIVREVMVTQICRDAGHMYSQGADFTTSAYVSLLKSLAPTSLSLTSTGDTTMYLSSITYVDSSSCTAGGLSANTTSCPNLNQTVIIQQVPVGSTSSRTSRLGTPSSTICTAANSYKISQANYLKDSSVRVASPPITLTSSSQIAYVSEMIVQSSDLSFWAALGTGGNYAESVF